MKICLITPAPAGSRLGNRHTALRWAAMLRQRGHQVELRVTWDDQPADLMLALHARRSANSIAHFHAAQPHAPLIVALTGTDIYRDIQFDATAQHSLALATRIIVLQDHGLNELAPALRAKTCVVYQSAATQARRAPLMVISSHLEAGANVICEAVAVDTPVIASAIPGNLGMLGTDYAGYYPPGDTAALATRLDHAERDPAWLAQLAAQCAARRPLFLPRAEAAALLRAIEAAPTLFKETHDENQLMDTGTERTGTLRAGG